MGRAVSLKKSIGVSVQTLELLGVWQRHARATTRRPTLSSLVEAALVDLPNDVDELQALATRVPRSLLDGGPRQLGLRIREDTVRRIEDAQFELSTARHRAVAPLWHCVTGALLLQLEAEGVEVPTSG